MLLSTLLTLLPLAVASPAAKPYNPFYPPNLDTDVTLNSRSVQEPIYSASTLQSRAMLENAGRAHFELDISISNRQYRGKRSQGENKRGQIKKVRRKITEKRAAKCAVTSTSVSTPVTSAVGGNNNAPASNTKSTTTKSITLTTTTAKSTPSATPKVTVDPYGKGPFSGWGTYFDVGLSACGTWDTPGMPIVAVSSELFDNWPGYNGLNPNNNPICGKHLDITWGGKTLTVEVTDRCPSCAVRSLDLSKGAFEYFADTSVGLLGMDSYTGNITWSWTTGEGRLPRLPYYR